MEGPCGFSLLNWCSFNVTNGLWLIKSAWACFSCSHCKLCWDLKNTAEMYFSRVLQLLGNLPSASASLFQVLFIFWTLCVCVHAVWISLTHLDSATEGVKSFSQQTSLVKFCSMLRSHKQCYIISTSLWQHWGLFSYCRCANRQMQPLGLWFLHRSVASPNLKRNQGHRAPYRPNTLPVAAFGRWTLPCLGTNLCMSARLLLTILSPLPSCC